MKKGDIYEGTVEKIEFPNKGILHIDGERVVVKNAIPGQKIQCVITKRRKGSRKPEPWRYWRIPRQKNQRRHVLILGYAAAVFTRACPMKNS